NRRPGTLPMPAPASSSCLSTLSYTAAVKPVGRKYIPNAIDTLLTKMNRHDFSNDDSRNEGSLCCHSRRFRTREAPVAGLMVGEAEVRTDTSRSTPHWRSGPWEGGLDSPFATTREESE